MSKVDGLPPRWRHFALMCVHEAGHAVAGVIGGAHLAVASVTGAPDDKPEDDLTGIAGDTTFSASPPNPCEVAYAGPYAAARLIAGGRPTQAQVFERLDACGREDRDVLLAHGGSATGASAAPLIERCWPSVCELAGRLAKTGKVSHTDVLAALSIGHRQAPGHELALIASGYRPGSFRVTRPAC